MNEITQIHLGRQPFTISVAAHKQLRSYLDAIEEAVGKNQEVLKEVELRMAELLTERGIAADKVILKEDIEFLQSHLGEPSDFREEDPKEYTKSTEPKSSGQKELYRDTDRAMLAGVSSGLAAYSGISVTLIRLLFVVLSVFTFVGVFIYLALWLIVPEVKTQGDRLRMKGKPVTVESLKEVMDRADVPGAARRAQRVTAPVAVTIAKALLRLVGVGFIVVSALILVIAAGLVSYFAIRGNLGSGIMVKDFGLSAWVGLFAGGLAATMVASILLIIGLALVRQKKIVAGWINAVLVAVLIMSTTATVVAGFDAHEKLLVKKRELTTMARYDVQPFKNLTLSAQSTLITYQPSELYFVEIKSIGKKHDDSKLLKHSNDSLTIDTAYARWETDCDVVCPLAEKITEIVIHAPSFESVTFGGSNSTFKVYRNDGGKMHQDAMRLTVLTMNNTVDMFGMSVQRVETAMDETARTFTLTGIGAKGATPDATVRYTNGHFELDRITNTIELTDRTAACYYDAPLIKMPTPPKEIVLNKISYRPFIDITGNQNSSKPNIFNCIGMVSD